MTWIMGYGPAAAWVLFVVARYGPRIGYGGAAALGLFTGLGVLGLTALFVAYFPAAVERLGFRGVAAFLRRVWDEDAR